MIKRKHNISVRLNDDEKEILDALADTMDETYSGVLRDCMLKVFTFAYELRVVRKKDD